MTDLEIAQAALSMTEAQIIVVTNQKNINLEQLARRKAQLEAQIAELSNPS